MPDATDSVVLENPINKVDFVKDRGAQPINRPFVVETEAAKHNRIKAAELARMNQRRDPNENRTNNNPIVPRNPNIEEQSA
jgi:hypothetical protein